jgi:hypothetical protein
VNPTGVTLEWYLKDARYFARVKFGENCERRIVPSGLMTPDTFVSGDVGLWVVPLTPRAMAMPNVWSNFRPFTSVEVQQIPNEAGVFVLHKMERLICTNADSCCIEYSDNLQNDLRENDPDKSPYTQFVYLVGATEGSRAYLYKFCPFNQERLEISATPSECPLPPYWPGTLRQ